MAFGYSSVALMAGALLVNALQFARLRAWFSGREQLSETPARVLKLGGSMLVMVGQSYL
jgi:hypothetical protein